MTGIKFKFKSGCWCKATQSYDYTIFQILVPNQLPDKNNGSSIVSDDFYINTINDIESCNAVFGRIFVEKINGAILKKKVDADKKLITSLVGLVIFYYQRYTQEQKEKILKMSCAERYDLFYGMVSRLIKKILEWNKEDKNGISKVE